MARKKPEERFPIKLVHAYKKLIARGTDPEDARETLGIAPRKFPAFRKFYLKKMAEKTGAEQVRAEQRASALMIQEKAFAAHDVIMRGVSSEIITKDDGTVTRIDRTELPNTRALDTALKALDIRTQLDGTKIIGDLKVIQVDFKKSIDAVITAVEEILLPDHEALYLKISARVDEIVGSSG